MRPPRALLGCLPSRRTAAALSCAVLIGAVSAAAVAVGTAGSRTAARPVAAASETIRLTASGSITVHWRGNGHGHGMSQYGAHGAAMRGLTTRQILAFYYPGTRLVTVPASKIRVNLTNTSSTYTTVLAGTRGLTLSGFGALPATGYQQFRLMPVGAGLTLQGLTKAGAWKPLRKGLPTQADFSSALGWVQSLDYDGSSIRYRGTIGAVRSGGGELTINRLWLDQYVEGSAPREIPASWEPAAVHAQAVAARSYAETVRASAGSGSLYDICDTTSCQAYGGMAGFDRYGNLQWTDDPDAIAGNENTVLRYQGGRVLAQYSASNGGATVDGGLPYLVGKPDPYDASASGDPYLNESEKITNAALARSYGLASVASVQVTRRDGNGPWGGRIESAYVNGTYSGGGAGHIATTGFDLGSAFGVYTDYLMLDSPGTAPSAPRSLTWSPGNAGAYVTWAAPTSTGGLAITGYRVGFGAHVLDLPATARSFWATPLNNLTATRVWVVARNAKGLGAASAVQAKGVAAPGPVRAVTPARLADTSTSVVDAAHPYRFRATGHGAVPTSGVRAVQLTVSVFHPTASGVLTVKAASVQSRPLASIAYRSGQDATATVSVPLVPSATLVFTPSAGRVRLTVDQQAVVPATGSALRVVPRQTLAMIDHVPTGNGSLLDLSALREIGPSATGVLLGIVGRSAAVSGLRIWADGQSAPHVRQVSVGPNAASANAVFVPFGSTHKLRIAATSSAPYARVVLLGVLAATGGRLESVPPSPIAGYPGGLSVGTSAVSVPMTGVGQVPTARVSAVLVQVTARGNGTAGALWAMTGDATSTARAVTMRFPATGAVTTTTLVRVVPGGKLALAASVPGVHVSVDAIGYVVPST